MKRDEAERLLQQLEAVAHLQYVRGDTRYKDARATVIAAMTRGQWRDAETDPPPKDLTVLLYCPDRGPTNGERMEVSPYRTSGGSLHAWATHWQPLPAAPEAP